MSRVTRGPRPTYYVCVSLDPDNPGELISKQIQATSQAEAASLFLEQTKAKAKKIHGPYRLKRAQVLENTRELKFSQKTCKAVYDNWRVTAMYLKEPENHAYLVLHERIDGQKIPAPKGAIIVPISDLRFDNE
jgi:hypothetical protein